jgi:hypothetical protein
MVTDYVCFYRELRRPADAIAANVRRLQNGEEAPMAPGLCAMRVVCVWDPFPCNAVAWISTDENSDYAKLTRKVGNKANIGSSNLRPKNMGNGDAPA